MTEKNPSHFKGDDRPVEQVSWLDAVAFCNRLSEREGLRPCYGADGVLVAGGDGYRLPTEAEWEYACRARSTTRFHFGDNPAALGKNAWFAGNSDDETHPVGQWPANAFGLRDMHGNVREWCFDWFDSLYYRMEDMNDPSGPLKAAFRVIQGGGWRSGPRNCRSAFRRRRKPDFRGSFLGFRVARVRSGREQ